MGETKQDASKVLYGFFISFSLICIITSFFVGGTTSPFAGYRAILTSSEVYLADAVAIGGLNGALMNVGLVGLLSTALLLWAGVKPNGTTMGAFFLSVGFAFFGKNCLNVLPIYLGAWLYSKAKKESFQKYAHAALFGCALAPVVSELIFPRFYTVNIFVGILSAVIVGALIGFIFPPFLAHCATMHKGHCLFNAGLAAGFIGMFFCAIYKVCVLKPLGVDGDYALNNIVTDPNPLFFGIFAGAIMLAALIAGFIINGGSFKGYGSLLKRTGHGCDFTALDGPGLVLINFGVTGFIFMLYLWLMKAPLTGTTFGAFLCLLGWTGNGSHPLNTLPIALGYAIIIWLTPLSLASQGLTVGLCFATGMSPISGRWGAGWGVLAGAMHICLVGYTGAFHGGFNLYNGGFTAGLTALVLIAVLEAFCTDIPTRKAKKNNELTA